MTASGVAVIESRAADAPMWPGDWPWAIPVFALVGEKGKAADSMAVRADRIERIAQEIARIVGRVDLAVIEAGSFGSKKVSRSLADERAALRLRVVGLLKCPVALVAPSTLKLYATGNGSADKGSVVDSTLALYELPSRDDNLIDAFVLARMGVRRLGQPVEPEAEEHQLRAMRTPKWEA